MERSQITITIALISIALFTISIFGFAIGFANDNDATMSITDDPNVAQLNLDTNSNISTFKEDSEDTYQSILDTTIEPGSGVAQSTGSFSISVGNIVGGIKNIVYLPYQTIFGGGSGFGIFFTTFLAFLVFFVGLLIYKTLRGNP